MIREDNYKWIGLLLFVSIVLNIYLVFFDYTIDDDSTMFDTPESLNEIVQECNNLSIDESANCFTEQIDTFFIYNETDDSRELSFIELQDRGGDCRDWAHLYEILGAASGFYSKTVSFSINKTDRLAHRIAIISDTTGYCVIDQRNFACAGITIE